MASTDSAPPTWWRRFFLVAFGPGREADLTIIHCVHSIGESFFAVSLAGSIFFAVSPEAARPRVLLFLLVSLTPFLVMAPLVGTFVDRLRGGLAAAATMTFVARGVLAVALAQQLGTVLLFPLGFAMLVSAKAYTVARNGLVPMVVASPDHLVPANSRLSRTATVIGAASSAAAIGVFSVTSASWTLRIAAVFYVLGAVLMTRLRNAKGDRLEAVEPRVLGELARPDVSEAIFIVFVLRGAIGFALFHFAFALRDDGAPVWMLGAVIGGNSVGAFLGTLLAPVLKRRMGESRMLTIALVAGAVATAFSGIAFSNITLVATMIVLGTAGSVGRRALDATIQHQAPDARLGRVYAGLETRLELAWVGSAAIAVAIRVASWTGLLIMAGMLVAVAIYHLQRHVGLNVLRPVVEQPLPERLLMRAETLLDHGYYDEAMMFALQAVESTRGEPTGASKQTAIDAIARARDTLDDQGQQGVKA